MLAPGDLMLLLLEGETIRPGVSLLIKFDAAIVVIVVVVVAVVAVAVEQMQINDDDDNDVDDLIEDAIDLMRRHYLSCYCRS